MARRPPHPLSIELGDRLRARREARGLTQERLGEIAGFHRTYIGTVEQGKVQVSFVAVARIAKALDVSLAELVDGLEFEPPS